MTLQRVKLWPFPEKLEDLKSVQDYLESLYVALQEESVARIEDFSNISIETIGSIKLDSLILEGGTYDTTFDAGTPSVAVGYVWPVNAGGAGQILRTSGSGPLSWISVLSEKSVIDKDLTAPPGGPSTGDRYIVATPATGAWLGKEEQIAEWGGSAWAFTDPDSGVLVLVIDETALYCHDYVPTGHNHVLDDLADVALVAAASGDLLRFDGSNWVDYADSNYATSGHNHGLDDLTDVVITAAASGDLLRHNGSNWVDYADSNYATSGHNHDSAYISIIGVPGDNHFPYQTATGELDDSGYDAADFATAGHNHDSSYISIIAVPATNHFPYQTAGGELIDSAYDAADFATAGHAHALDDLSDVNAAAPNNNDSLTWDSVTSKWVAEAVAGGAGHNILSATHPDSTAASAVRGDIIIGSGVSPLWTRLAVGASTKYLAGGTEPSWATLNQAAVAGLTTADGPTFDHIHASTAGSTITEEAWIAPTLLNSWVNFGWGAVAGYMKDSMGFVHLKGNLKSGTIGADIFVLPVGYRIAANERFTVYTDNGVNQLLGSVTIEADGSVLALVGNNTFFSLGGVTFRAA